MSFLVETVAAFSVSAFPGLSSILDKHICSTGGVMFGGKTLLAFGCVLNPNRLSNEKGVEMCYR